MFSTTLTRALERTTTTLHGSALSYKALFNWLNPLGYISSRLVRPVGMAIAFTSLSSYYGAAIGRTLVGASLLSGVGAVLYGMALSTGNERSFGTLGIWLASPQNKWGAACQRAMPHLLDGFFGGMCTYVVCSLLYGSIPIPVPAFAGLLAVSVTTTFGFGLSLSALALLIEDVFVGPNTAELVLMVVTGALVSPANLPSFLRATGEVVPLTHAMQMVEGYLAHRTWDVSLLPREFLVGTVWLLISSVFLHVAVRRATRRTATD